MADSSSGSPRARVLIIAAVIIAALGALVWFLSMSHPARAADAGQHHRSRHDADRDACRRFNS